MVDYKDLESNRQIAPVKGGFPALLEKMKPEIARALPRHLNADRMMRIALTEDRKNPEIGKCELKSVMGSIVILSQLGLEPGIMGQAYLIPYKGICTAVPGWQGYVDLVSRSGRASVWTGAVYAGDEFDYGYGDRPFITHRPSDRVENSESDLLYMYAVGRIKNSEWPVIEVWSRNKVMAHRDKYNKVGSKHYSYNNFEMYGRKVALMQVIKYMPKSVELQTAVDLDNTADAGGAVSFDDAIEGSWSVPEYQAPAEPAAESTQQQAAPEPDPEPEPGKPAAKKKKAGKKKKAAKKAAPAPEPDDEDSPGMTYNEIFMALNKADTVDRIDELLDAATGIDNKKKRDSITAILNQRRADLTETPDDDLGLD